MNCLLVAESSLVDAQLQAWDEIKDQFRSGALLLGNGGSRAVWDSFEYSSLFEEAQARVDHPLTEADKKLFGRLGTTNFEAVLSALRTAEMVCESFELETDLIRARHDSVRVALMESVQSIHVPWARVPHSVLLGMRRELARYSYVFTTNYDLLVYWAVMCEEDPWPFRDYFWSACADGGGWVCFDAGDVEVVAGATRLLYLHGALHLIELPSGETAKVTVTAGEASLLDHFAVPEADEEYPVIPLVITEGSSDDKMAAIRRSEYLSFAYERLSHVPGPLTVFGHSLSDQDQHLVEAVIKAEPDRPIAISIRGDEADVVARRKLDLLRTFTKADLHFFDASTHPLGRQGMHVSSSEAA